MKLDRFAEAKIVLCTCPEEASDEIAKTLVEEKLAACVNVIPNIKSVYRWQGKVEQATESQLIIKTTNRAYPLLQKKLKEVHPYKVPEILALSVTEGLPDYLAWIINQTSSVDESES